jgi:hypothetical protein
MTIAGGPRTREDLKQYSLRRLGYPVIEINVDDAQIEDRIDDSLQFFAEYHFDGVERVYLAKQITKEDVERKYIDFTLPTLEDPDKPEIKAAPPLDPTGNSITSVIRVFQLYDTLGGIGMFDARYQIALNDLYGLRTNTYSDSMIAYDFTRRHMQMLQDILTPEKSMQFSRVTNKLYINMNWDTHASVGQYMVFECFSILDPNKYGEIYNDRILKQYVTAKIKEQWGRNLSKFDGVALPGGITLNGNKILGEARDEIRQLEEEIQLKYEEPPIFFIGG